MASAALLLLGACSRDNPAWCEINADCVTAARAGEIPSADRFCLENICYSGCTGDEDCRGGGWSEGLRCDTAARLCVRGATPLDGGGREDVADLGGAADGGGSLDVGPGAEGSVGLPLGSDCEAPGACASGWCVDGTCCGAASCGRCQACNVEGQAGSCAPVPDDDVADEACLNAESGCEGRCDGAGGCLYDPNQICGQRCASEQGGQVLSFTCQAEGSCGEAPNAELTQPCHFSDCLEEAGGKRASCTGDCAEHEDCIDASVCDRTALDESDARRGQCVDPLRIVATVTNDEGLKQALEAAAGVAADQPTPVVRLQTAAQDNSLYKLKLNLDQDKRLLLIAEPTSGAVTLATDSGPAIKLGASTELAIQGLRIDGTRGIGIECDGEASHRGKLTLVESTIKGSADIAVFASRCSVAVRRSTIDTNTGGGLSLSDGAFSITNSVIVNNGSASTSFGGVSLSAPSAVVFVNDTVANNQAKAGIPAGVLCPPGGVALVNSLLAQNANGNVSLCGIPESTTSAATLGEACGLSAETWKPTSGACLDGGDDAAAASLSVDRAGAPRKAGAHVDRGAFEVQ